MTDKLLIKKAGQDERAQLSIRHEAGREEVIIQGAATRVEDLDRLVWEELKMSRFLIKKNRSGVVSRVVYRYAFPGDRLRFLQIKEQLEGLGYTLEKTRKLWRS